MKSIFSKLFPALLLISTGHFAQSAVITLDSSTFTMYYGVESGGWTIATGSSSTTQGNFTFSPNVATGLANYSGSGPTFANGVLSNGPGYSGSSTRFSTTITGTYTGPTPGNAAPTPNYQISIVIDSVSIYGVAYTAFPGNSLNFNETTSGHAASSSSITLNTVSTTTAFNTASNYKQLAWNPADYSVAGTTTTRSFNLSDNGTGVNVDGFTVIGRIQLTYDAIPEPATAGLFGIAGLAVLLIYRRRH